MSTSGLFVVGVLVTLIVAAAVSLLIYAAILDGRYAKAHEGTDEREGSGPAAAPAP